MTSISSIAAASAEMENFTLTPNDATPNEQPTDQAPKREKWVARILKQGPWNETEDPLSLNGAPSLPMPVEVSDKESLAPFFAHLRNGGTHEPTNGGTSGAEPYYNVDLIEFGKGVLYADGRVDLCKMVTGPRNIGDLMDSVKPNTFTKHFLLGNNIIGPTGAKAIADFIVEQPDRFETWYLAGNCIDTAGFKALVDAMVKSPIITNVWLKRNPLLAAAAPDLFRLITQSPALRTLDLDQTELGDAGVAELFSLLADHNKPIALRHIYLNGVGISSAACEQISRYLATSHSQLVSLYLANNPVGNAVALLAPGIKATKSLERLSLQSCGLKDKGTIFLLDSVVDNTSLKLLDIGQAYATEDLNMRFNWLTCSKELVAVIKNTALQYFSISYTPLAQPEFNSILHAAIESSTLLVFQAQPLVKGGRSYAEVKAGQAAVRLNKAVRETLLENVREHYGGIDYDHFQDEHKRFLLSPQDVRLIDSVYRNRDAGLARRGLKILEKHWDEGDDTLTRVQAGEVD